MGPLETPTIVEPDVDETVEVARPWVVVVWNDPINLMSYVVYVFQKLFGYSREKATKLMLDVHYKGKAADVRRIARDLGVRYLVEGSARRAAGSVSAAACLR